MGGQNTGHLGGQKEEKWDEIEEDTLEIKIEDTFQHKIEDM